MKDEIKEMIDKTKKCLIAGYDLDIITQEEMGNLWNYITNLQETKTNMEQEIQELYLIKDDYKSRIDKAVEYNNKNIHSQKLNNILEGSDDNE